MPDRAHEPIQTHRTVGATDCLLLLMAVMWGVNYSAVKYASQTFSPLVFAWLRVMLAAVTLLSVTVLQGKPWPPKRDMAALVMLGLLGNGIYQLLFVEGVSRTRVADAALIVASVPAWIAMISRLGGLELVHRRTVMGIVMSVVGVGIVVIGGAHANTHAVRMGQSHGALLGDALMLCAVMAWGIYTVSIRSYVMRVDPLQLSALTLAGGVIVLLPVTPAVLAGPSLQTIPLSVWGCLVYSSVGSLGIAYLLWFHGVRVLGPTRASVYGNLQPIVAILVGWVALHEAPTVWQAAGAGTIIGGVFLTRTSTQR